jgi:hypothetical protein
MSCGGIWRRWWRKEKGDGRERVGYERNLRVTIFSRRLVREGGDEPLICQKMYLTIAVQTKDLGVVRDTHQSGATNFEMELPIVLPIVADRQR